VTVDIVTTEGETGVAKNLQRKAEQSEKMFAELVRNMNQSVTFDRARFDKQMTLPSWL
jgi:hypothetical protein